MKILLKIGSYAGLLLTAIPGLLVFTRQITFEQHTTTTLIGAILWFATAPFWIGKPEKPATR